MFNAECWASLWIVLIDECCHCIVLYCIVLYSILMIEMSDKSCALLLYYNFMDEFIEVISLWTFRTESILARVGICAWKVIFNYFYYQFNNRPNKNYYYLIHWSFLLQVISIHVRLDLDTSYIYWSLLDNQLDTNLIYEHAWRDIYAENHQQNVMNILFIYIIILSISYKQICCQMRVGWPHTGMITNEYKQLTGIMTSSQ